MINLKSDLPIQDDRHKLAQHPDLKSEDKNLTLWSICEEARRITPKVACGFTIMALPRSSKRIKLDFILSVGEITLVLVLSNDNGRTKFNGSYCLVIKLL